MIIHEVEQGTLDWMKLRLGIPTASEFHRIITPTGQFSKQSRAYAMRLVTERLLNRPLDGIDHLEWVARGKELEPDAVRMYEYELEVETRKVGFITTDDGRLGASPDRLIVGQPGGLEVKCPSPLVHVQYLVDGFGLDYLPQVQGQMLVAELEWVDRWSYSPDMPPARSRTDRDEPYIRKLRSALDAFNEQMEEMLERVRSRGFFTERAEILSPMDAARGERMEIAE